MSVPIRRAGRTEEADGRVTTWTIAEGRRGRRWRWTVTGSGGGASVAHTLETSPAGAFERLESATAHGLLTLHREADGSVHGNLVGPEGVRPIAIPAPAPDVVLIDSGPVGSAALIASVGPLAEAITIEVIRVDDELRTHLEACTLRPLGRGRVLLDLAGDATEVVLDADGLPAGEVGSTSWPLEEA